MTAQDSLRIAQALLRACKAELVEARLSDRYGVTLVVHPTTLGPDAVVAADSTLADRRAMRVVMGWTMFQSLLADGVNVESVPAIANAELTEVFGIDANDEPVHVRGPVMRASPPPLDVNEQDCPRCGANVATTWDADNVGRCTMCGSRSFDMGREETLRRRAERGWVRPRGAR